MMVRNGNNSQAQLLHKINEVSFAVDDILLYLDTHPCCEEAFAYYQENAAERRRLMKEYAKRYGPLTIDDALESGESIWKWAEQPFPWEKEGACR